MKGAHSAIASGLLCAAALALCALPARAQDPIGAVAAQVAERYPAGSIASAEAAEQALRDVEDARARVEWAAYDRQVECSGKFFSTPCAKKAKDERRTALGALRAVEIEAQRFQRRAKDAERERKRQQSIEDARLDQLDLSGEHARNRADLERKQDEAARNQAEFDADASKRQAAAVRENQRRSEGVRRAAEADAKEADMTRRRDNVRVYEQKQRDAQARREEIEKKRAERAAREAAKPPATTPPS